MVIRFYRIILIILPFIVSKNVLSKELIKINDNMLLKKSSFDKLNGWQEEDYKESIDVFLKSCDKVMTFDNNLNISPQLNKKITKIDFYTVCKMASIIKNYNDKYIKYFFENYFTPYKVIDSNNSSLFTGYYLPQINAKRSKDDVFKYPIYKRPSDLFNNKKYYTRKQINSGALKNKNLEILYTDNIVDLFFFHIQGSGNVFLVDENRLISIGYDGKNNHKFTSIGNFMLKNKLVNNTNSKNIKNRLKNIDNIKDVESILNNNDSYIFFKIIEDGNIIGAFGTELIPFRTIAVDKNYIPLGFPLWLSTKHTMKDIIQNFNRFVIANDTGSAVKGVVRGDIFFGSGIDGENNASYQYSNGEYYLILPNNIAKKISN